MDRWLTVTSALHRKAFVADLNVQPVPLVGAILRFRPCFTLDFDIYPFIPGRVLC